MQEEEVQAEVELERQTRGEPMHEPIDQKSYHPGSLTSSMLDNSSHFLDLTNLFSNEEMRLSDTTKPLMVLGTENELENLHVPTTVIEPNTQTQTQTHPSVLPLKRKLFILNEGERDSVVQLLDKDVFVITQTALPPPKYRIIELEVPAILSMFSLQDIELQMAKQFQRSSS